MKAILCPTFGDASVLTHSNTPEPALNANQVRIRVRASGVNRADIHQRKGNYPPPPGESDILGLEAAGDVLDSAADGFRSGDRVMALLAGGGYAEIAAVDAGLVMPLPARLSYAQGAAIPEAFITAHHNLFTLGGAAHGQNVLIHAGASGVGTAAIQLLNRIGARVFATVGAAEKAAAVSRLGARAVNYHEEKFEEIVRTETAGRGVEIILDPIGGPYLARNFACLAVDGRVIQIAFMAGRETSIDLGLLLAKRIRLIGSTLRPLPLERKRAAVAAFARQFLGDLETGAIGPIMDRIFPAAAASEAHMRMEANRNIGKIVLEWQM